ncbi:MAG TPA: M14 family metallopeptidase [Sediminibacterium sp.]|uniref:M14 family metallopeptidase n=1 Tax=Sediminibacterium sp. TaxID=1917865 RepID=UPI0008CF59C1|nr:M14 family metallopeptidase [Sediminibacterium sp.]OHC84101.1 MAG: zinc carboxypeptidase [Sphingobacteriia bacterium RIFOXYC2_FULL_35_18]OHC87852.1 MAG: zinc carboxypeptidase [Sphingobacteriia bacterium RIFOXYD2_FULL_35_12]HLD52108.1 M14 family metallopeptidase [Sediminibacterium sp.]
MKKLLFGLLSLAFSLATIAQSVPSPEQFLGYKVGTRFTRHHRIVEYVKTVATARPDMVKVEKYGETNEGRELMLAFVSTPENMQQLDQIRINNLRMAGLAKDKAAPQTEKAPAIVWLSYNVHGNEASSSEAFLLTIHALTDPANAQTKEWLKNTVVVLDPCINPDGRDRYINWYNSVVGKNYNADPASREHAEPWPGGRSNHYNFDLNRDWAWQTQVETQQRIKKYQEWMPQIHVDYHEQGFNEPYYFAPAAEPIHEVITPWQRDFQVMIGRNHAKYFDQNNWLFFTKERFDLLYPSYGDTYPVYNGAIGMTYEQGGIRAGLGILNEDNDTLTLVDRAAHHFTTGLSTIEIASKNKNKLLAEFQQFFDDSRAGRIGEYKTYVFTAKDENKMAALKKLLNQNGIEYGVLSSKTFRGFNYFTGKEDAFTDEGNHIAVSSFQPRAVMAKVLLEPRTVVTDSNTYDITAWAASYAYGIKGYAVKEKLAVNPESAGTSVASINSSYGALVPYTSFSSAKVLAYLLKNGVKVRFVEKPFTYKNKNYDRGTLVVLKTSNQQNWLTVLNNACAQFNVQADAVETGFMDKGSDFGSPDIKNIAATPKVAMLTGEQSSSLAAGEVWHYFDKILEYPITLLNAVDIARYNLKNYDVLIIPDGNYRGLGEKATADKLKEFVRGGGKLIALENAMALMSRSDWGIKLKEAKADKAEDSVKKYANRETDYITNSIPGAIYKVDLDNTHPLAFGYPEFYYTLKQDGNVYEMMKDGWNVGTIKKDAYVTGFAGAKLKPNLKDGMLFGVQDMGAGTVVYIAEDPLFRNFWENGYLLIANAVFLAGK